MRMDVNEAQDKLSDLLAAAERGEEAIIARRGEAVARLIPLGRTAVRLGALRGAVPPETVPDFLEPMSDDDLAEWGA